MKTNLNLFSKQLGSAHPWGGWGREFKSLCLDHYVILPWSFLRLFYLIIVRHKHIQFLIILILYYTLNNIIILIFKITKHMLYNHYRKEGIG